MLEIMIEPAIASICVACSRKDKTILIDAGPNFFKTNKNIKTKDGTDNYEYNLKGKEVYLTPNLEKNLGIVPYETYDNLTGLEIMTTSLELNKRPVYSIEGVILEK